MFRILLCSSLLFVCTFLKIDLQAQTFGPPNIIIDDKYSTKRPISLQSEDLNGDGFADVIVVCRDIGKIVYYKNDQQGNFSNQIIITSDLTDINPIALADIDGDSDIDIISGSAFDKQLFYFKNDGSGNFGEAIVFEDKRNVLDQVGYVKSVGDVDQDGDIDLLVSTGFGDAGNDLLYYKNNGWGNFGNEIIITEQAWGPLNTYFDDIDLDGDLDLIYSTWADNEIAYYRNDGHGNFNEYEEVLNPYSLSSEILTTDIDNDGDVDILCYRRYRGDSIAFLINNGHGDFDSVIMLPNLVRIKGDLEVVDINEDGLKDIVFTSEGVGYPSYFLENNGNGSFLPAIQFGSTLGNPSILHFDDLDNDGDLDLLTASYFDNKVAKLENIGTGNFGKIELITQDNNRPLWSEIIDLDSDGDEDILSLSYSHDKIIWYANDGTSDFGQQQIISQGVIDEPIKLRASDVDQDGDIDILVRNKMNSFYWLENLGNNNFHQARLIFHNTESIYDPHFEDLDNDGDIDLTFTIYQDPGLFWVESLGNGQFEEPVLLEFQGEILSYNHILDLDVDGHKDVLYYNANSNSLNWFRGIGANNFEYNDIIIDSITFVRMIKAADLDADSDLDLVLITGQNSISYKMFWLENTGNEEFVRRDEISTNFEIDRQHTTLLIEDINKDSHLDVIYNNRANIVYCLNNGNGAFEEERLIYHESISNDYYSGIDQVLVADFDSDEDLDIFCAVDGEGKLITFENLINNPVISCQVYYDENGNGGFDEEERGISLANVHVEPNSINTLTSETGFSRIFVDVGDYSVSTEIDSNWVLTSLTESYEVQVNSTFSDTIYFGYAPNQKITDLDIITSANAITRCGRTIPFSVTYRNSGTTIINGFITITDYHLMEWVDDDERSTPPDSLVDGQPFWKIENLYPGESGVITLYYIIADQSFVGDTIILESKALIPMVNDVAYSYPNPVLNNTESVKICHCTGSSSQPYILMDVPFSAIDGEGNNDHGLHDCDIIPIDDINLDGQIDVYDCFYHQPDYDYLCFTSAYESIVRCSFDPNDKRADPVGYGSENYTLKDQNIIYTIRFQNTGNDTAFHVQIIDTLDVNLNLETFDFLAASHEGLVVTHQMMNNKVVIVFSFDNLILPDSATDEIGSQGFVMFSIQPVSGVAENTIIKNKASIVFDHFTSYPIITNTVKHTLVTEIPYPLIWIPEPRIQMTVFPNPTTRICAILLKKQNPERKLDVIIFNLNGKVILHRKNEVAQRINLEISEFVGGIYLIMVKDSNSSKVLGSKKVVVF